MLTIHAPSSRSQQLSLPTVRHAIHRFQSGFSLLELVVVMGILAIFASVSLTFVGEKDVQQRYQQSIEKLQAVKRNFFSVDKFQGQTVMHGFFVDNGMMGETTVEEAITTSFETILNTRTDKNVNNDPALKDKYRSFGFIDEVYIEDSSENVASQKIEGAGLYKGIRPGAYDLSEYLDNYSEIRDAWGDEFLLGKDEPEDSDDPVKFISLTVDESQNYKNFESAKVSVSTYVADVSIKIDQLKVSVENLPDNEIFRIAIASFSNSASCKTFKKKCWTTKLSNNINTSTVINRTFILNETTITSATFDESEDEIQDINPIAESSAPKNLTEFVFTDKNSKTWQLSTATERVYILSEIESKGSSFNYTSDLIQDATPVSSSDTEKLSSIKFTDENNIAWLLKPKTVTSPAISPALFTFSTFPDELAAGSHVAVLLKENSSITPKTWSKVQFLNTYTFSPVKYLNLLP